MKHPIIKGTITGLITIAIFWSGYYFGYKEGYVAWYEKATNISGGYELIEIKD